MLNKITPQEEKALLQETLIEGGINHSYSSMAELMDDKELSIEDKHDIILHCLAHISRVVFNIDNLYSYEGAKDLYTKYANEDLFRAIGGISLTGEDMDKLLTISPNKEGLVALSLFFDTYQDQDSYSKMIESVSPEAISRSLLLMPSLYKFTEDKVQEIIKSYTYNIITFAASPRTKDFLTKENFLEVYKIESEYNKDFVEDLKDAYYDLFGESLTVETL